MKNIFKNTANFLVATALLAAGSVSCENFLAETNYSGLTAETYFNQDNAEQLITAAYVNFRSSGVNAAYAGTDLYSTSGSRITETANNEYITLNMSDAGSWSSRFTLISRANVALNRIENQISWDNTTTYQDKKAECIAHAKMLRGFGYYKLAINYGGVPILLDEVDNISYNYPRDTEEEVMAQALEDMLAAVDDLPDTDEYFFTKRAAYHVLADYYITRAGKSYGSTSDYSTAAAYAELAIGSHDLCSISYADLFDFDNQVNDEVLLAAHYSNDGMNTSDKTCTWYLRFVGTVFNYEGLERVSPYGYCTSYNVPTPYFYELLLRDPDDTRDETIIHRALFAYKDDSKTSSDGLNTHTISVGDTVAYFPKTKYDCTDPAQAADKMDKMSRYYVFDDPYYYITSTGASDDYPEDPNPDTNSTIFGYKNNGNIANANFPIFKKFSDEDGALIDGETYGTRNIFLIRVAESHLLAAEAYLGAGDNANALKHINKVHERASGNPAYYSGTLTIDDILDERGIELAGEENRWYALVRAGKLKERCELHNPHIIDHGIGNIDESIHCLRMISTTTIENSQYSITQNPGYSGYEE